MHIQRNDFRFLATGGIAALLILTGAGCQKSPPPPNYAGDAGSNTTNNASVSPSDVYSRAVDVDIPEATDRATADQMKAILSGIFGNVKTSGFISNFIGNGALSLEYTLSRASASDDVRKLSDALKQKNYHIDQTTVYDGNAVVMGSTKTVQVTFSFAIGDQKISVLYSPIDTGGTSGN